MNESLKEWITDNNLSVEFESHNILTVKDFGKFLVIEDKELTFDDRFILNLYDEEIELLDTDIEYLLFKFGSLWFYHHKDSETELNLFRYLGESNTDSYNLPFLGLHGKYELCNGSRDYKEWCKKLKFLKYSAAGICEYQTLAGCYYFQDACQKEGIKPIHGRTNQIKAKNGSFYHVKSFVKNQTGWKNLLRIHNIEMIENVGLGKCILEEEFCKLSEGLIHIIDHETDLDLVNLNLYDLNNTFFQFNPVKYTSNNKDQAHLLNLKKYTDSYISIIKPIILQDCYYLDKYDGVVKPFINKVIGEIRQFDSKDEYLKSFEEIALYVDSLFKDKEKFNLLLSETLTNYEYINNECNYLLATTGKYLPSYIMNEDERLLYSSNEEMFFSLVEKGFLEKIHGKVSDEGIYLERLEKEITVLKEGNVIDYFLILYDIFSFMKKKTDITSLGRGSSAGSLVSFLLGIVQIDPIKYDLIFERFLNKARLLSGSLPDIDSDIPSHFRQEVIDYLIKKYGKQNVTHIGTAQDFKLKSGIKDVLREKNVGIQEANLITSVISAEDNLYGYSRIFNIAYQEKLLKGVIEKYPDLVYLLHLVVGQPRSFGIHAGGIVIFPAFDSEGNPTTALDYVPLRISGDSLVTEWEKSAIENAGFLKADLLGLAQLDKIIRMNELIKQNGKQYDEFLNIDLQDEKVLNLFKKAITEDVFQFNTDVQKLYLLQLKPESVDDLIAANALNRPGTMSIKAHSDYIEIKDGIKEKERLPLIDDILEPTRSLIAYQEQVMFIYQRVTDCDMAETDKFRKVVTTLAGGNSTTKESKLAEVNKYKDSFIQGYLSKGVSEEDALKVWDKIIAFTSYSFNKSHAASYAITGYWVAYYKAYFPLEFYTASLEFADSDLLPRLINEINGEGLVSLMPPDINKSGWQYSLDSNLNEIYWSLISIKFAGQKAIETLLEEREKNGKYFSFEEFVERAKATKVNKRVIINFILSGCFDKIENIKEEKDRLKLLNQYSTLIKQDVTREFTEDPNHKDNFYWILLQRKLCGLGMISYEVLFKKQQIREAFLGYPYVDPYMLQETQIVGKQAVVSGIFKEGRERTTRKGIMCQLLLDCNDKLTYITLWPEAYALHKSKLIESNNKPIFISGTVVYDDFKKLNVIQSSNTTKVVCI